MANTFGPTFPAAPAIGDSHKMSGHYGRQFRWDGKHWVARRPVEGGVDIKNNSSPDIQDYYNSESAGSMFPNLGEVTVDLHTGAPYVFHEATTPAPDDNAAGENKFGSFYPAGVPFNAHVKNIVDDPDIVPPWPVYNNGTKTLPAHKKGDIVGYSRSATYPVNYYIATEDIPASGSGAAATHPTATGNKWRVLDMVTVLGMLSSAGGGGAAVGDDDMNFKGDFVQGAATFKKGDVVRYGGTLWIANMDTTAAANPVNPTWEELIPPASGGGAVSGNVTPLNGGTTAAKPWAAGNYYPGDIVTHNGKTYFTNTLPAAEPPDDPNQYGWIPLTGEDIAGIAANAWDTADTQAARLNAVLGGPEWGRMHDSTKAYKAGQTAYDGDVFYKCIADAAAGVPLTDATKWVVVPPYPGAAAAGGGTAAPAGDFISLPGVFPSDGPHPHDAATEYWGGDSCTSDGVTWFATRYVAAGKPAPTKALYATAASGNGDENNHWWPTDGPNIAWGLGTGFMMKDLIELVGIYEPFLYDATKEYHAGELVIYTAPGFDYPGIYRAVREIAVGEAPKSTFSSDDPWHTAGVGDFFQMVPSGMTAKAGQVLTVAENGNHFPYGKWDYPEKELPPLPPSAGAPLLAMGSWIDQAAGQGVSTLKSTANSSILMIAFSKPPTDAKSAALLNSLIGKTWLIDGKTIHVTSISEFTGQAGYENWRQINATGDTWPAAVNFASGVGFVDPSVGTKALVVNTAGNGVEWGTVAAGAGGGATVRSGTAAPTAAVGNDGDLFVVYKP